MSNAGLALDLEKIFVEKGYKWKVGDKSFTPGADLIAKNLDGIKAMLYDDEPGSIQLLGRLLVLKRDKDKFDVYMMIGEDNDTGI